MGYKKAADGITKKGKTVGKNLGDTGPTVAIQKEVKGSGGKDRKSTRLNSSHSQQSRMPSSA